MGERPDFLLLAGNAVAAIIHLATAVFVLVILFATTDLDWTAHVGTTSIIPDASPVDYEYTLWYSYRPAILVAVFSLVTAVAHLLSIIYWETYEAYAISSRGYRRNAQANLYVFAWVEYSFSASLMMVCMLSLSGSREIGELVSGAVCIWAVNMLGLVGELALLGSDRVARGWRFWNQGSSVISSAISCLVAWALVLAPWIGLFIHFFTALANQDSVPLFLWILIFNIFFQFSCFGFVYVQQNWWPTDTDGPARRRKFALFYIMLSLAAKQSLAWNLIIGLQSV